MAKKIRYLLDDPVGPHFLRVWKERREIIVQVWLNKAEASGEPDGDWAMPGVLGLESAAAQAVNQTEQAAAAKKKG